MDTLNQTQELRDEIKAFILRDGPPDLARVSALAGSRDTWKRLSELGTELWLDTGSLEEAAQLYTPEFSALTTNNTLLNREVQKGLYDDLIVEADQLLSRFGLTEAQWRLEMAFILNAIHGLKLVARFNAKVSVEEHTDLADEAVAGEWYARRYYEICPERFIVKIPLTPAGLLVTRRLAGQVPVNHTLGFSARQNYVIARLGQAVYSNVFIGRLGAFVKDNALGDGEMVGEQAVLAAQHALRRLPPNARTETTRLIGASFRSGQQLADLAGIDVMTIPPKVAQEFLDLNISPSDLADRNDEAYLATLADEARSHAAVATLWDIGPEVVDAVETLSEADLATMTPGQLVAHFADHDSGDFLPDWTPAQRATSLAEGKIPRLDTWRDDLSSGRVGLDALMNLAGLSAFTTDQKAMDARIASVLSTV